MMSYVGPGNVWRVPGAGATVGLLATSGGRFAYGGISNRHRNGSRIAAEIAATICGAKGLPVESGATPIGAATIAAVSEIMQRGVDPSAVSTDSLETLPYR